MDYLVLKKTGPTGGQASEWQPCTIVRGVEEETALEEVARQAYDGDSRYKVVEWPDMEGSEFDLTVGPPAATPVKAEAGEPEEEAAPE